MIGFAAPQETANCSELCPAGAIVNKTVDNAPLPSPTPNGCGPTGLDTLVPEYKFNNCCNLHDTCYNSCNATNTKSACDQNFYTCMVDECKTLELLDSLICRNAANVYAGVVKSGFCDIYLDRQNSRCECRNG
ncbi:hypothetical protein BKA69DRAFT_1095797 [Paraphysoderma sedebokerense]|nr:hypothetical protein BKA69DRAFT_1095797 [Paraphysoderma sedebokerense]